MAEFDETKNTDQTVDETPESSVIDAAIAEADAFAADVEAAVAQAKEEVVEAVKTAKADYEQACEQVFGEEGGTAEKACEPCEEYAEAPAEDAGEEATAEDAAAEDAATDACEECAAEDAAADEASEPCDKAAAGEPNIDDILGSAKEFADKAAEVTAQYMTFAAEQAGAFATEIGRALSGFTSQFEKAVAPEATEAEPVVEEPVALEDIAPQLRLYKSLLDEGLITEDDYEAKKRQLLGL